MTELSSIERNKAHQKYKIIQPYLNNECTLQSIANTHQIPRRTLSVWVKRYQTKGLLALARKRRRDKGHSKKITSQMIEIIKALYLEYPQSSRANIYRLLAKYYQNKNITPPSYRTVCHIIHLIPDDLITLSHQGAKVYKQKYDLLCIRNAKRPNQIWQADHVLMDIKVLNNQKNFQPPWLTVIIDDCSRAICGYELSFFSPSAQKTSLCLRHAIWRKSDPKWPVFGVPEILYTDHGSDFTSQHIEQVCIDLKIQLIYSKVGEPRGRGKVERFFRTLNQTLLSDIAIINKGKGITKLSLKQLDKLVYQFIVQYNNNVHSQLGVSPVKRWQEDGFLPNILESIEYLDLLLLTVKKPRTIRRDGIHFQGLCYFDVTLAPYVGQSVIIRYKPSNITSIRVFFQDKFLCEAVCNALANQTVSIKDIEQARNERKKLLRKEIKQRKSLIDALILSSRKDFGMDEINDETITEDKPMTRKIKLYRND
jgi:putative transposase